ncbi:MAG: hypothetical protein U0271_01625 [Polyangiaceae bacterium]
MGEMGSEPTGSKDKASLRVQALAKRLARHPNGTRLLEYAKVLDGWIHEWARYGARKDLRAEERGRALAMLSAMRRDFNALLTEAEAYDPEPKGRHNAFGTALDELGPEEKLALAQILGLPFEPAYRPLFEVKAAEYLEQDQLWNEITEDGGFVDAPLLGEQEARSAVVLTYSGSLLLVSAPIEKNFRRRYVYQSIYAGHLPTEGTLGLLDPIRKNRPVAGTRIKTSPVRKLRVSRLTVAAWDEQRQTFQRLHFTLNGAATPPGFGPRGAPPPYVPGPGPLPPLVNVEAEKPAPPRPRNPNAVTRLDGTPSIVQAPEDRGGLPNDTVVDPPPRSQPVPERESSSPPSSRIPSVFVQVLHHERQRDHVKKLEEAARAELRTLLSRLVDLAGDRDHTLEAEILGQVMHLQRLAIERGEMSVAPGELSRLQTENDDTCAVVPEGLAVGRVGAPTTRLPGGNFGDQTIVRSAPIAVLSVDASLFAVLGNVRSYVRVASD